LVQPLAWKNARLDLAMSRTEANFYNPFGATAIPGSQTIRGAFELTPVSGTTLKMSVMGEKNRTNLVDNERETVGFELRQKHHRFFYLPPIALWPAADIVW